MTPQKTLIVYQTPDGKIPFKEWIRNLKDQKGRVLIWTRLDRLEHYGHAGGYKRLGKGVLELKIDFGPGYRIYFGERNQTIVLILLGGDKSSQARDIQKAMEYWEEYKRRK